MRAAAAILVAFLPLWCEEKRSLSFLDAMQEPGRLSSAAVARLENALLHKPGDLSARARLIVHYTQYALSQPRVEHIVWVIEHHPGSKLAGSPISRIAPASNPLSTRADYERARIAWVKQVDSHPKDADVLANAARFFEAEEPERAEALLRRSLVLDPSNQFRVAALARIEK